jgi:hypothetical protein
MGNNNHGLKPRGYYSDIPSGLKNRVMPTKLYQATLKIPAIFLELKNNRLKVMQKFSV